jgi:hypothetical protein
VRGIVVLPIGNGEFCWHKVRNKLRSKNRETMSDVTNDSIPIPECRLLFAKYNDNMYTTVPIHSLMLTDVYARPLYMSLQVEVF